MKKNKKHSDSVLFQSMKSSKKKEKDQAFEELYERYSRRVYAYCVKVTRNRFEADDIFQEVFSRFYNKAENYNFVSVLGLLITIARNLCLNRKRDRKYFDNIDNMQLISEEPSKKINEMQVQLISIAVETLDMKYKEPLVLKVYNNLSYEEISIICEISVVAARSRVFRAKKMLKKYLEPHFEDYFEE